VGVSERTEFLAWYEEQKSVVFNNRQTLESYCQDDVTVLRQACQVFRDEFLGIAKHWRISGIRHDCLWV
jgi:hypothetical protein